MQHSLKLICVIKCLFLTWFLDLPSLLLYNVKVMLSPTHSQEQPNEWNSGELEKLSDALVHQKKYMDGMSRPLSSNRCPTLYQSDFISHKAEKQDKGTFSDTC